MATHPTNLTLTVTSRIVNNMDELNIIEQLRLRLQPKGTRPLVRLQMKSAAYFEHSFVESAVDELERKVKLVGTGLHEMTPLETLAFHLLIVSAEL